jgi:phosphoribosylformylglycinamidine (FGAM) synthase-like enzyme
MDIAQRHKIQAVVIGKVTKEEKLVINEWIEANVSDLKNIYDNAIESCLK